MDTQPAPNVSLPPVMPPALHMASQQIPSTHSVDKQLPQEPNQPPVVSSTPVQMTAPPSTTENKIPGPDFLQNQLAAARQAGSHQTIFKSVYVFKAY